MRTTLRFSGEGSKRISLWDIKGGFSNRTEKGVTVFIDDMDVAFISSEGTMVIMSAETGSIVFTETQWLAIAAKIKELRQRQEQCQTPAQPQLQDVAVPPSGIEIEACLT